MGKLLVTYQSNKIEKICKSEKVARKEWGDEIARHLQRRMSQLEGADALDDLLDSSMPGHWELLTGDLAGKASARLGPNHRLLLEIMGRDELSIRHVEVLGRTDYHKGR